MKKDSETQKSFAEKRRDKMKRRQLDLNKLAQKGWTLEHGDKEDGYHANTFRGPDNKLYDLTVADLNKLDSIGKDGQFFQVATVKGWAKQLNHAIVSYDGFRDVSETELIFQSDYRDRLTRCTVSFKIGNADQPAAL
jgi:hypothetical protein